MSNLGVRPSDNILPGEVRVSPPLLRKAWTMYRFPPPNGFPDPLWGAQKSHSLRPLQTPSTLLFCNCSSCSLLHLPVPVC
uniref:Uncharacterized protein n=1 Tax=Anguilla anguilla TaxID=7936 RepID=A0A0E9RAQ3_ANGAN